MALRWQRKTTKLNRNQKLYVKRKVFKILQTLKTWSNIMDHISGFDSPKSDHINRNEEEKESHGSHKGRAVQSEFWLLLKPKRWNPCSNACSPQYNSIQNEKASSQLLSPRSPSKFMYWRSTEDASRQFSRTKRLYDSVAKFADSTELWKLF